MHATTSGRTLPNGLPITFGSICSGMEAASEAAKPLGWRAAYYSEIEDAPISVLKYRQHAHDLRGGTAPAGMVGLWGDFGALRTRHMRRLGLAFPDVLIGGTPCQGFSVAGLRGSMSDDRSNLALAFVRHAHAIDAVREREGKPGLVVLWENVPGVLSTDDNAFGCLLGGFVGSDTPIVSPLERGRWTSEGMVAGPLARAAWRVLNAEYFGLAQRRERVFLVVSFRDGADPAEILFERRSVHGNSAPRREAGQRPAATLAASLGCLSGKDDPAGRLVHVDTDRVVHAVTTKWANGTGGPAGDEVQNLVALADSEPFTVGLGSDPLHTQGVAQPITGRKGDPGCVVDERVADADKGDQEPLIFQTRIARNGRGQPTDVVPALNGADAGATSDMRPVIATAAAVRRLLPRECDRLQGYADDYSLVPHRSGWTSDSARYRMLGNSMPVPVIRWICERIQAAIFSNLERLTSGRV